MAGVDSNGVSECPVVHRTSFCQRVRCRVARLWLGVLQRVFRFDAWHSNAPYSCRPYKRVVVGIVNSLRPKSVVEVGCGLGEILSRTRARQRFGFDSDPGVVRAARFLHPRGTRWIAAEASAVRELLPRDQSIDCLVMINWIHGLRSDQLAECVLPLLPRARYLLFDAIDHDALPSYRFRHDFQFLTGVTERISTSRVPGEPRSFVLFRVI
jgi:SAM-dependent methyltransferase